jgi:hypothetical protein
MVGKYIDKRIKQRYKISMKKIITVKRIIIFSMIMVLIILGITASCVGLKNNGNNKILAQMELDILMFQIENNIINLEALNEMEYIEIGHKVSELINIIGKVKSEKEHYFRINFSRAPLTLSEMINTIQINNSLFKWKLMTPGYAVLHMYGDKGEYNIKFISEDGYFEAVYNRDGELLTQYNDPLNMGTFNYADQINNKEKHTELDVMPYFRWGNTNEERRRFLRTDPNTDDHLEPEDFNANSDAVEHYKNIYKIIYGKEYINILE